MYTGKQMVTFIIVAIILLIIGYMFENPLAVMLPMVLIVLGGLGIGFKMYNEKNKKS